MNTTESKHFYSLLSPYVFTYPVRAKFDMKLIHSSDKATSPFEKFDGSGAGRNGRTPPVANSIRGLPNI